MEGDNNINGEKRHASVPDGGWGWVVVFSSFMIHFIMDGITYAMAEIYLEPMMKALNGSRASISPISSNLPALTYATGPVAAVLTNMYGCRIVTIIGACLAASGFFLSRWWDNIVYYYITIGIMAGIGFGLVYEPALVCVGYYFERKKAWALGIAVSGSGFGTVVFPPLMHWMIKQFFQHDYKPALLVQAGIILTCVLFGVLMKPLPQERSEIRRATRRARRHAKRQTSAEPINFKVKQQQQEKPLLEDHQKLDHALILVTEARPDPDLVLTQSHDDSVGEDDNHVESQRPVVLQKDGSNQGSDEKVIPTDSLAYVDDVKEKGFIGKLKHEVGVKLLADSAFLLFTISNFMTSLGFNVPYNFARDLAKDAQVIEDHREYVIMSIGLSNAFGRLIIGKLGDWEKINRLYLYNITLVLAGLATVSAPYCGSIVITHIAYASVFGFFSGGYVGLTTVVITDLVGIDRFSSGLGVILLFQGLAAFIGTPLTGYMRDKLSDHPRPYLWPYTIFGGFIVLSGLILFGIPLLQQETQYGNRSTKIKKHLDAVSSVNDQSASYEKK